MRYLKQLLRDARQHREEDKHARSSNRVQVWPGAGRGPNRGHSLDKTESNILWSDEAGDRNLFFGVACRGGQRKLADRLSGKLKKAIESKSAFLPHCDFGSHPDSPGGNSGPEARVSAGVRAGEAFAKGIEKTSLRDFGIFRDATNPHFRAQETLQEEECNSQGRRTPVCVIVNGIRNSQMMEIPGDCGPWGRLLVDRGISGEGGGTPLPGDAANCVFARPSPAGLCAGSC